MEVPKFSKKLMLAAAVVILLNFSNCKYDDGPAVSLLTKTMRLTGEWEVVEIDNENLDDVRVYLEFEKDGDFTIRASYDGYSYSIEGDWEWESGKDVVEVTVEGDKEEYEILRLTNKELWFEDEDNQEWQCEKE